MRHEWQPVVFPFDVRKVPERSSHGLSPSGYCKLVVQLYLSGSMSVSLRRQTRGMVMAAPRRHCIHHTVETAKTPKCTREPGTSYIFPIPSPSLSPQCVGLRPKDE